MLSPLACVATKCANMPFGRGLVEMLVVYYHAPAPLSSTSQKIFFEFPKKFFTEDLYFSHVSHI